MRGGAEQLAFEVATGLSGRGHAIEVLTTCSESFHGDWYKNVHRPGFNREEGLEVFRFPVDQGDSARFAQVNNALLEKRRSKLKPGCSPLDDRQARDFIKHNINSFDLLAHIRVNAHRYDAYLFLPYLYGTTLQGWRLAQDKSVLIPCLHDEPYAYLLRVDEMMRGVARILFNSDGDRRLGERLYGPSIVPKSAVSGSAVFWPENPSTTDRSPLADGFLPEEARYALFLGRRSPEKNIDLLLRAYARFRSLAPDSSLQLILAGPGPRVAVDSGNGITDLGTVTDDEKNRLLRHCAFLAQPSLNESYSRVLMEAWAAGRPAVVHRNCSATADAVRTTGAGWSAGDDIAWQQMFLELDALSPAELSAVGGRAGSYVRENASWERVLDRYETAIASLRNTGHEPWAAPEPGLRVDYALPKFEYGTGTSRLALAARNELRHHGYASDILADAIDPQFATQAELGSDRAYSALQASNLEEAAIFTDPARWNIASDATLMNALQDGRTNILFVGAIEPINAQLELLDVFGHYLSLDFNARLMLIGRTRDDVYREVLSERIDRSGLAQRILVPGLVSESSLAAFYRSATIYCSLSGSPKTPYPLVEAMWFDLPICAKTSAAVRKATGPAGILVEDTSDRLRLAALWKVLATDQAVRHEVLLGQRVRRNVMLHSNLCGRIGNLVATLA